MKYTVTFPDGSSTKFYRAGREWRIMRVNGHSGFSSYRDAVEQIQLEGGVIMKDPVKPKKNPFRLF